VASPVIFTTPSFSKFKFDTGVNSHPIPIVSYVISDKSSLSTAHSGSSSGSLIPSEIDDINVFSSVYELIPYLNEFLILATSLYNALMAENKISAYEPSSFTTLEGFAFKSLYLSAISIYLSKISSGSTLSIISFVYIGIPANVPIPLFTTRSFNSC
jgi:hypothetical protein